ncbi:MAG: PSD1 and planctomycete cytochrome C domain-containing protein, partial [Planctomycetota bacterium]
MFSWVASASLAVDFRRDVRPILARACFKCHGPDEEAREAGLRLDVQSGSRADLGGYQAIVPGAVEDSELIARVLSEDPDLRMPPTDEPLSDKEIETLKAWVAAGGEYVGHWAFERGSKPDVPETRDDAWPAGPMDRFVLKRIETAGLSTSGMATKTELIRRVSLDLTGLTPAPDEVAAFLRDDSPLAYEKLVDRLLATPEYGERFARPWLDLARYSDTNGYEKDRNRTIWPYRDWVIGALNADLPYDQFSIEQLAGDMLPSATRDQRIATGFHRNTMLNEEGGIDPLEFRFYAMVDRVATTGTVWMGLTTGCAQCHTHKYDPITHTDYFALMALMDNADEPEFAAEDEATIERREELLQRIRDQETAVAERVLLGEKNNPVLTAAFQAWMATIKPQIADWRTVAPTQAVSTMPRLTVQDDGAVLADGDATKRDVYTLTMPPTGPEPITAIRIEAMSHPSLPATGPGLAFYEGRRGDFYLSELDVAVAGEPIELGIGSTTVPKADEKNGKTYPGNVLDGDGSTGWSIPGDAGQTHRLVIPLKQPQAFDEPWTVEMLFERHYVAGLGHFRIDVTTDADVEANVVPSELQRRIVAENESPSHALQRDLAIRFLQTSKLMASHRKPVEALRRQLPKSVRTLVLKERDPSNKRTTRRHHRGEYLQPKEVVSPNVPAVFADDSAPPKNRLQLAEWLVSDRNPLVGRVTVNRAWREFFGVGIVRTAGDFGTQSEPPSHPELLDWLDAEFRDQGRWSLKRLHREIVLSATYRQRVGPAPESDPDHRLLSAFPYRRLDAERIRDAFLSAAGLLTRHVGGASVYPPQPAQVMEMAYGNNAWPTSKGGARYRRSLYTFSKRTAPFAAFTTFDAPSGEVCIARRDRSTTPLQALTLLNDAMYLEIAEGLAEQALRDERESGNVEPRGVAQRLFKRLFVRAPRADELQAILDFYQTQSGHEQPWMLVARA